MDEQPAWPLPLRVGTVAGGFEMEGGYNGPGQPANNWCWWEAEGRAPRRLEAEEPWTRLHRQLAAAAEMGADTVRLSIEWARCEPFDGQLDMAAIDGYCRLLDRCHEHGLQPMVTLHRFAHPAWMGVDLWLRPDSPERFRRWAETAVDRFAGRTHQWVTVDQLNLCSLRSYLSGHHPPGRKLGVAGVVRSLDHLLAAHVLAYEAIKERQPQAVVGMGQVAVPVYELDGLLVDVLLGRSHGIDRHDLEGWLPGRRDSFHEREPGTDKALTWMLRHWAQSSIPLHQALARAVAAVYDGPCTRPLDVLQVSLDHGDLRHLLPLRLAHRPTPPTDPVTVAARLHHQPGLPLWMVSDQPLGVERFRLNLMSASRALEAGVPVAGYYHRPAAGADAPPPEEYRQVVDGLRSGAARMGPGNPPLGRAESGPEVIPART